MRRHYLDNIRWMTIVTVVVYHVIYLFNGVAPEGVVGPFRERQWQDAFLYLTYPWFMVLLFLVAGMCSRYYLEGHTVKEFVRSRTRKLLVPSTLGVLLMGWIQGYFSMSISDAFSTMPEGMPKPVLFLIMTLSGTGVLWFIQLLWLFSMLLALLCRGEKGKLYGWTKKAGIGTALLLFIPVWLSGQVLNAPVIVVYRFGIYGFVFFLGYFVFAHDEVVERIGAFRLPLLASSAVLGGLYLYLHYGENYAVMPMVGSLPAALFGWVTVLTVLGGMRTWGDGASAFSRFMTGHSFGLYVFHYLPLSACAWLLRKNTALPALPCYVLTGIAAFGGALFLYEVISRIPFLRLCILGIKGASGARRTRGSAGKEMQGV